MPKKKTHEEFLELLKIKQPNVEILSEYCGDKKGITARCTIHDYVWETRPNWLVRGSGCQKCYDERRGNGLRKSLETFIEQANALHNNKYDYSNVIYTTNKTKVPIICPEHGVFYLSPEKHINRNQACSECQSSFLERSVKEMLEENNFNYIKQYHCDFLKKQSLDFYLPDYNVGIECQGVQHFEYVDFFKLRGSLEHNVERDMRKYNACNENGLELIYVSNLMNLKKRVLKEDNIYNEENTFFVKSTELKIKFLQFLNDFLNKNKRIII